MKKIQKHKHLITAYIVSFFAVAFTLLPVTWLFMLSIKSKGETFTKPPKLFFDPTINNYVKLWDNDLFKDTFFNSIFINKIFKENTPELKPYYAVSFYLLISTLLDKYVITNMEDKIFEFFLEFENYRQKEKNKPEEKDPEIMEFEDKVSHSSDSKSSLEWRHDFFITRFGIKFPEVPLKDENRNFSYEQRRSIWRRDKICRITPRLP